MAEIIGKTTINGEIGQCVVRVYSRETGDLVRETLSDPVTGVYVADKLSNSRDYDVLCFSNDGGIKAAATGPVKAVGESYGDPHWASVVALLHFDGDLIDESTGEPWTALGSHTYAEGLFGDGLEFLGRSSINGIESPPVDFGDGDFTIEVFCRRSSSNRGSIIECRADNSTSTVLPLLDINDDGSMGLWVSAAYRIRTEANTLTTEIKHIALTKYAQVYYLWVNGTLLGSYSDPSALPTTTIKLSKNMRAPAGDWNFEGLFDELRITKGVARYTEDFTPPIDPFPEMAQ